MPDRIGKRLDFSIFVLFKSSFRVYGDTNYCFYSEISWLFVSHHLHYYCQPTFHKGGVPISKKVGRPYSENPKDIRLTVRLDQKHNDILERYSAKYAITKNESVRRGIEKLEELEKE